MLLIQVRHEFCRWFNGDKVSLNAPPVRQLWARRSQRRRLDRFPIKAKAGPDAVGNAFLDTRLRLGPRDGACQSAWVFVTLRLYGFSVLTCTVSEPQTPEAGLK